MRKDLPTRHNIEIYIHNEFMDWLKTLKSEILVSSLFLQVICTHFYTQKAPSRILLAIDGWTADNMKASFLGMIVSWIEVKGGKWKLHSKVVGFQPVLGNHSSWNLNHYIIRLCNHVRILNKNWSKVCVLTKILQAIDTPLTHQLFTMILNNTSNNNMTCEAIETFHTQRWYDDWKAKENQLPCMFSTMFLGL